jgi:hypothetical protein
MSVNFAQRENGGIEGSLNTYFFNSGGII